MSADMDTETITMQEMTMASGLSEHALRYYEKIGLLEPVARDISSGHRQYHQDDVYRVITLACLRATGMSIDEMRYYFELNRIGVDVAHQQIELFENHKSVLVERIEKLKHQLVYLDGKVNYWKAIDSGEQTKARQIGTDNYKIAQQLNKE